MKNKRSFGYGFADEVIKINSKKVNLKIFEDEEWKDSFLPNFNSPFKEEFRKNIWRITILVILMVLIFFTFFLRLFHIQIVEGSKLRELADGNRIQIKVIHAPRGVIYDRNGKILAQSSPAFRLYDTEIKRVRFITREEALDFEVNNDPRAQFLEVDNVRTYPMGESLAHVVGYTGEISREDLKKPQFRKYKLGDRVGQTGVEAEYETLLKGIDGGEVIEVDSQGRKVRTLRRNAPIPGQSIYLTLDSDLQKKLYELVKETLAKTLSCCGAAVAQDPQSGQILALTSHPSFDPNIFTNSLDDIEITRILSRSDSPILNRVISGTYPPGSTFKIVSSLAALASGKITKDTIFQDSGEMYLGTFRFTNWYFNQYGKTEGPLDLIKALQRSNDIYFYQVGSIIGEQALIDWARKLFLGNLLNIDLPAEVPGLVPDDDWKRKTFNQIWYPGDTLHMAIGQGFVLTTPLQILGITSYIAADGELFRPQILSKVIRDNVVTKEFKSKLLASKLLPKDKIETVARGLEKVPLNGGTAWPFFTFPIKTAGKTGTAEYGDPKNRTHAWYTSYAPADNPRIVLTILIEGGGEGSSVAAPVAKEVYRWYFSEDKNNLIKDSYTQATDSGKSLGE